MNNSNIQPFTRDPLKDELLTPQNCALLIIDIQPLQVTSVASMDRRELVTNIVTVAKTARLYGAPIVLSTVNVERVNSPGTIPQLMDVLPGAVALDRTFINSWEDTAFRAAVEATGRRKLVIVALWTEACLTFPTLDAIREGFEVYPVVDAVGGTSLKAHDTALRRLEQAGAQPIGWAQFLCELQRNWARAETRDEFSKTLFAVEGR